MQAKAVRCATEILALQGRARTYFSHSNKSAFKTAFCTHLMTIHQKEQFSYEYKANQSI